MLTIAKFGGSSLADGARFLAVRDIVRADPSRRGVVVSAAGRRQAEDHKVTDLLYLCHEHLRYSVSCDGVWRDVAARYLDIRSACGLKTPLEREFSLLREQMERGVTRDYLASRGEYFAALLMADLLEFRFLDSAEWLHFFYDGTVDVSRSYNALKTLSGGEPFVTPGFYGAQPDGRIHTFPRGGSDITGALAAAALGADLYENWTDVNGILLADPRIVADPRPVPAMTYDELRELSLVGTQVLHEGAVLPVREKGIPIRIRSAARPQDAGTLIRERLEKSERDGSPLSGITGRRGRVLISVTRQELSLWDLPQVLEELSITPDFVTGGMDRVTFSLSAEDYGASRHILVPRLGQTFRPDRLQILDGMAFVSVIGPNVGKPPSPAGRLLAALSAAGVEVSAVLYPCGAKSILFGVRDESYEKAVRTLYAAAVR